MNQVKPVGLYLHIPFCDGKCPYCDFYSTGLLSQADAYTDALLREMEAQSQIAPVAADTLYLGGGTPALLGEKRLIRLLEAAQEYYCFAGEATLEANPNSVTPTLLGALAAAGYNRISFGMQSAVEEELRLLGRKHSPQQLQQAVLWAKEAGFTQISVDLMLGIPKQTIASALVSVRFAEALEISHLSAYLLKIEENTLFAKKQMGEHCPPEDEVCELYLAVADELERAGFRQYEISNFAKVGNESRHNLKYWSCEEYLGFGPAAHGYFGGKRYGHTRDLKTYLKNPAETVFITDERPGRFEEYAMLRLRLTEGLSLTEAAVKFELDPAALRKKAARYQGAGLLIVEPDRIRLTPRGFLVSNALIADLIL